VWCQMLRQSANTSAHGYPAMLPNRSNAQLARPSGLVRYTIMPGDRPLGSECEPEIGAHIWTPRRGYTHHGIYVGNRRVVQYGGLSHCLRRGPVEEVSLSQFARGREIWIRTQQPSWSDSNEVVRRARFRLGEDRYRVFTNNCEHFCEWCVRGEQRSYQVDVLLMRCLSIRMNVAKFMAAVFLTARSKAHRCVVGLK